MTSGDFHRLAAVTGMAVFLATGTALAQQGYSLTNKVWQVCNRWLIEANRANGSPAILFVDPKTQTIVDVDFST